MEAATPDKYAFDLLRGSEKQFSVVLPAFSSNENKLDKLIIRFRVRFFHYSKMLLRIRVVTDLAGINEELFSEPDHDLTGD